MISIQFFSQIIILAIGFGVGYWLIIIANNQLRTIKTLGQTLGGVLIAMALILEIFSAYYFAKIPNKDYTQNQIIYSFGH